MENTKAPKPNRKQTKLSVAEWLHSAQGGELNERGKVTLGLRQGRASFD